MRSIIRNLSLSLAILAVSSLASAKEAFVIGVAPHSSARIILEMYQPLRLSLEKSLGMPVAVVTAPDFTGFARRALAQEYDIAITTGNQARLLQTDARYLPILTYKADFKSVVIVADQSPVRSPGDLKGKNVLGLSPASFVTMWGEQWLADQGVSPVSVKYVSASDSVANLVIAGGAAAGFTSLANFQHLEPSVRSQLRLLAQSAPMAGRIYMLNGRHARKLKRIDAALWAFSRTAEAGRYFDTNKLEGYRKLRRNELAASDRYAARVRKIVREDEK